MDPITQQTVIAAAGAGGGDPVYVDDVFSTYLVNGTGAIQTVNNGIDLAGEGGMVWSKSRNQTNSNGIHDTERGINRPLSSDSSDAAQDRTSTTGHHTISSFNSNGFTLGADGASGLTNYPWSSPEYVHWTFRKAPGFFDVVTFTGTGSARTVAHNLGSVPGMIMIKGVDVAEGWTIYHRSLGATKSLFMSSQSAYTSSTRWNDTAPTSSVFTVGSDNGTNQLNKTYVAYIFAHDDASFGTDGDESIIKCGSFEGNAGTEVDLGFEPQWVLVKRIDGARDWFLIDNMRGMSGTADQNSQYLRPNGSNNESDNRNIFLTSTGFTVAESSAFNTDTHIYMAIRRPHKPPETAAEVFAMDYGQGNNVPSLTFNSGFPVDMAISREPSSTDNGEVFTRLLGKKNLVTNLTNAEVDNVWNESDSNEGWGQYYDSSVLSWMFKRAPGFFDVVTYTGNGSTQNVSHNLQAEPELVITKVRDGYYNWLVYSKNTGTSVTLYLNLNTNGTEANLAQAPDSSLLYFAQGNGSNENGKNYIAYLFATLPGISKVGSYTGTGNDINVDCGFTNGARFVLIKNASNSFDWNLFDTTRGITVGNDPYLALNSTAAQYSAADRIDPLPAGFTVSTTFSDYNAVGDTYIFLAIA